ncbi:hypothetical protein [Mycobacterium sp. Aquia_213]|uniref:hypothetical protein n=1 Tax=Mycobacterium sp. Aquia_213 TaxID=2991728 RepID=UPI0022714404|nr:hypothetical protein [Mycobacterium sp. Aquia_213]WAC90263.1 hypothetical protein LMQ14_20370 [Mycobacterium sp. Aquia_213]
MASLTPADVKRWDLNAIRAVFETATGRANTLQRLGESLQQAHNVLADWQGEAGDAFRVDVGKIRRDIEADGAESRQVAAAVSQAEADVSACKRELDQIEGAAQANGWSITPDWRIDVGPKGIPPNRIDLFNQLQTLQGELSACKVHAHTADHELATAIGAAVGAVSLDAGGSAPGGAPAPQGPPSPEGKPKTWQDMLLPPGAADAPPGGAPPKDPSTPAGKPKTWQDLLMPADARPGGAPPKDSPAPAAVAPGGTPLPKGPLVPARAGKPRSLNEMLLPAGPVPLPQPSPAELESAKALLRKVMLGDGVPPDQIEARVNEAVAGAQRWIDQGGIPPYMPPAPKPGPPPGFGEGFGDRWFATEESVHNLLGVGNRGLPGALEAWQQMVQGTVETVQNPAGAVIGEAQNALNSPSAAYYLGGKASDAAVSLPAMLFGPEVAGVGKLADIDAAAAIDYGPTHLPHTAVGFEHQIPFHPLAGEAGQDLNFAFTHGEPTTNLARQVAEMSTHYVGDNPDRVVLGKFGGLEAGYIGEARGQGGIFFSTGDPAWDAMTYGLGESESRGLVWQVNEEFLRGQMENAVPRIEFALPEGFDSVEQLANVQRRSYSALEINFLKNNAAAFGYEQRGNVWVYVGGR